ncbi:hypothetical protein [Micromonospora carbonacea]|uniref:Uncharacterized protein n=1 Tax=Micromonospora carbonacea TaxID=47853 RepID=A0A1C5ARI1_9ACTN|nr:hypothetical protein [Micromonospora carbonacea]SCF47790.1 hypothetical protein GA0070563_11731 [Micromonospora carbonacea]
MTLALYVLDVAEFEPLVRTAQGAGMQLRRTGDYWELSSPEPQLILRRQGTEIRTALWHAALTGGLDGRIVSFTSETIHLEEDPS